MMNEYPKVLIINSNGFNDYKGGGITLKNLFLGWPIDKIALAHWDNSKPMENVCQNYYRFGYEDHHYIFPLNHISNEPRDGISGHYTSLNINGNSQEEVSVQDDESSEQSSFFKRLFLVSIDRSGLREYLHPLRLTETFKKWVLEFKPDIIYCQSGDISFTNMVMNVQRITNAKIVVHIMDDWPATVYKKTYFSGILRYIISNKFKNLLRKASLRLGISEAMQLEFEKRYKLPFKYFHNPVNCNEFDNILLEPKKENRYLVVYSGRIGIASHDAIIDFAKVVEGLRKVGYDISFNIYTDLQSLDFVPSKFSFDGTFLLPALKDKDYIAKMTEADLLLYPVDFDEKSVDYIRLSFPTKLPSYLSSGVPIFCYGPSHVHSIDFIIRKKLGFVCTDQNYEILKEQLINALLDDISKKQFAQSAQRYAKDHFEKSIVKSRFHSELKNLITT